MRVGWWSRSFGCAAIALTLDGLHPEAGLLPARWLPDRSQALRWLLFVATELYPVVEINDYPERFAPSEDTAPAVREIARRYVRLRRARLNEDADRRLADIRARILGYEERFDAIYHACLANDFRQLEVSTAALDQILKVEVPK